MASPPSPVEGITGSRGLSYWLVPHFDLRDSEFQPVDPQSLPAQDQVPLATSGICPSSSSPALCY